MDCHKFEGDQEYTNKIMSQKENQHSLISQFCELGGLRSSWGWHIQYLVRVYHTC